MTQIKSFWLFQKKSKDKRIYEDHRVMQSRAEKIQFLRKGFDSEIAEKRTEPIEATLDPVIAENCHSSTSLSQERDTTAYWFKPRINLCNHAK